MTGTWSPRQNEPLANLPTAELRRLLPLLEPVLLPQGLALWGVGDALTYAYFPTTAIISLEYMLRCGDSGMVSLSVGFEGAVGISPVLSGQRTLNRAVVKLGGAAFRIKSSLLLEEYARANAFAELLQRYANGLPRRLSYIAPRRLARGHQLHFLGARCRRLASSVVASARAILAVKIVYANRELKAKRTKPPASA